MSVLIIRMKPMLSSLTNGIEKRLPEKIFVFLEAKTFSFLYLQSRTSTAWIARMEMAP